MQLFTLCLFLHIKMSMFTSFLITEDCFFNDMHVQTHQTQITGYETYSVRNILSFVINREVRECPSLTSYCCFRCVKRRMLIYLYQYYLFETDVYSQILRYFKCLIKLSLANRYIKGIFSLFPKELPFHIIPNTWPFTKSLSRISFSK